MTKLVLALGGNALQLSDGPDGIEGQQYAAGRTAAQLFKLAADKSISLAVTHGNGPQVGTELLRHDKAKDVATPFPLDVLDATTEGYIGYVLQNAFQNALSLSADVRSFVSLVTQVVVDKEDSAFQNPSKFVGPVYDYETAKNLEKEKGWVFKEDKGRGYRRVVPSPMPRRIVELDAIRALMDVNIVPITVGGGGIPVIEENGILKGVEAVIDKDLASSLLAVELKAEQFVILTQVDKVYINFKTDRQQSIERANLDYLKELYDEGHFPAGSMGPKILAAIKYLERVDGQVAIGSLDEAEAVVRGVAGTIIYR
ncbi:carbamate kinase [Coprothermobacter platensis]|uniref:carbamate kinase n=1 Tax=Coprothermobacter platensis TaxID=108819 RepID=UPI00035E02E9|nr:carbamate kinase [Coprothermobacter platensis]